MESAVGSNLALNKPIIGTGTSDGENVVSNLVDGLIATRWSVSGYPQAATVDLGEIYAIERTELVAYTDRDYKYTIAVATSENGPFTQIVDRSENTSPATELNPNINIFSVIEARFVKITVTGSENYTGDWISLLEFRVFGISTSVADDDDDGVLNSNDKCPNTSIGTSVDANGCALLESNNFKIEVLGETCSGKNNGKLVITAVKDQDYTLTYYNETFSFTSEKTLENLTPGTYSFCIEVIGVTSPYCYTVVIPEATTISGKSTLTNKQLFVNISKGTLPYKVIVNGSLQFKTFDNDFNLEVNHGDLVEVKTEIECEGVYSKNIELFNSLNVYPNPSMGLFSIPIETNHKTVEISVFNTVSKLVLSKIYNVINSKVQLDLTHKPRGIYFVKVHLDKDYIFKVVKH
ncbi:discoidin domain-containing protein [Lutibacter sp. A64]|nr:discoidin domain-containing protein [Lutibacter sp. A64]